MGGGGGGGRGGGGMLSGLKLHKFITDNSLHLYLPFLVYSLTVSVQAQISK